MYINKYSSNIIKIATVVENEREGGGGSHAFDDGHASLSFYCHLPFDIRHCAPCDDMHTSWQPQCTECALYEFLNYVFLLFS